MTPEQAIEIMDAHDVSQLLSNQDSEEYQLLQEHNPALLDAYIALEKLANS